MGAGGIGISGRRGQSQTGSGVKLDMTKCTIGDDVRRQPPSFSPPLLKPLQPTHPHPRRTHARCFAAFTVPFLSALLIFTASPVDVLPSLTAIVRRAQVQGRLVLQKQVLGLHQDGGASSLLLPCNQFKMFHLELFSFSFSFCWHQESGARRRVLAFS